MNEININKSIEEARALLAQEKNISSALRVSIELILTLVTLIVAKKGLNSKNSSKYLTKINVIL